MEQTDYPNISPGKWIAALAMCVAMYVALIGTMLASTY